MSGVVLAASFFFLSYTYLGYPFVLWMLAGRRNRLARQSALFCPRVSVVISAFNEELYLRETLDSILASDYPGERLDAVVVSDASTDGTAEIAGSFGGRVRVWRQSERRGQTAGLLHGAKEARGEIILMADASGVFMKETVRKLAACFSDLRVGAASGTKRIRRAGTGVSVADGFYARYDSWLRTLESRTGSSWVGCQGGLFAIRKALLREDFPLDMAADNAMCYELYERGARHRVEPSAWVLERPSNDLGNEFQRKVRIIVLQLRGVYFFRRLFNPVKHPAFFFQNVSHKIFRWLAPFALVSLWVSCGVHPTFWAKALFRLQNVFYLAGLVGIVLERRRRLPRWLSVPSYFVTVNLAAVVAWTALFHRFVIWEPPKRSLS